MLLLLAKSLFNTAKLFIFLLLLAMLMIVGLFRKRTTFPTALIFSLSPEQVFCKSSPIDILSFFSEDRFTSRVDFSRPIIEVKSLKTIFRHNQQYIYDSGIYLLTAVIKRRQYQAIYFDVYRELSHLNRSLDFKLRSLKREILDKHIYLYFLSVNASSTVFVTTNSSLFDLPNIFKLVSKNKKVMIWYSTNSKIIYSSDDLVRKLVDYDGIVGNIDEHWVWDRDAIQFLEKFGIFNSFALGSMLFQARELSEKVLDKFIVTYFDVTPFQASIGFYSEKNTIAVLENVALLAYELDRKYPGIVQIRIKPKREYSKTHSLIYISKLKEVSNRLPISLIPASANLYKSVSESDFVLAFPFSSPAILAKELCVSSAFLSTGIMDWDIPAESNSVPVVFDLATLIRKVSEKIELKFDL